MNERILFITESYYDSPSPNGSCVKKVADTLIGGGADVHVLTLKNERAREDAEIDGVKVYRVNTYLEWRVLFSKRIPHLIGRVLSRATKLLKALLIPRHPLRAPRVLRLLTKRAEEIAQKENIQVVIGVYRDFETVMAAVRLKEKFGDRIKLIIYTLDAISGGVCSNRLVSERMHVKKCREWELKMLSVCDIYCALEAHRGIYADEIYKPYTEKIRFVDVPNLLKSNFDYGKAPSGDMNFVFTGMLSETNADPSFFLGAFAHICASRPEARFNIYGGVSAGVLRLIEKSGLYNERIFFHGRVEAEALDEARRSADILLNFGNEHFCGIPCKIFEYVSTGKPIVSFYKIDGDASTPYLKRYKKAILIKNEPTAERACAEKILTFFDSVKDITVEREEIYKEYYSNTPDELAGIIRGA
ncbi:MAG: glycosyltransferase [Clostridia bacterium]|nr:glycosyltransferase [Clostridia bacterium]